MTEDEAKTKWCPHIRNIDPDSEGAVGNKYNNTIEDAHRCIASDCMYGCDDNGKWLGHCGLIK